MVSQQVKIPFEALQKFVKSYEATAIENFRLKRTKILDKLAMRILKLCITSSKSIDEISYELKKKPDYVKKVVDKLVNDKLLIPRPKFTSDKGISIEAYKTEIYNICEAWGIKIDKRRMTELQLRSLLLNQWQHFENQVKAKNPA